jgi:hypothetical protein
MNMNEDYDADEILRDGDDYLDELEAPEEVDELDFEGGRKKSYDEMVSDLDEPNDLIE